MERGGGLVMRHWTESALHCYSVLRNERRNANSRPSGPRRDRNKVPLLTVRALCNTVRNRISHGSPLTISDDRRELVLVRGRANVTDRCNDYLRDFAVVPRRVHWLQLHGPDQRLDRLVERGSADVRYDPLQTV